jgi:hypothetical protein
MPRIRITSVAPNVGHGQTWWMLVAGIGLGEVVTDGAAARPVVAAREGRAREETVREKGKVQETEGGDEPEAPSGGG